ncbi:MAG: sulfurtransferase [Cyclobacteriaceae bacterium]|nr:sulfurtransferase [Cyclobacteriaceae bacterium]MDH5251275.1 sulfurtransferase [Cyclobacteriaceae bacterium]
MANSTSPLISPQEIYPGTGFVIIDARSGGDARERYAANHLEGALHADLDRDLMRKPTDPAYGGRHPLPEVKDFTVFLGKLGITPSSRVVVYDDKSGANAAARFWWMLRAVGHKYVQVVDGGLDAIMRAGLPMSSAKHEPAAALRYPADSWTLPTVTIDDVASAATNRNALIIDVREAYRYRGESEPIDLIAGHIPGAVNIPYLNNLTDDGIFRSGDELASQYNSVLGTRDPTKVIVHCGSGVTACHTLLALEQAGIKGASLYVGSWSEWSRRGYPIGTGE